MADGAIHLSANCYLSWLKFYQKFYSDTKTTQTPVSERELAKKKIRKILCKKKNELKKKEKKCGKIAVCNAIEKPHTWKLANEISNEFHVSKNNHWETRNTRKWHMTIDKWQMTTR